MSTIPRRQIGKEGEQIDIPPNKVSLAYGDRLFILMLLTLHLQSFLARKKIDARTGSMTWVNDTYESIKNYDEINAKESEEALTGEIAHWYLAELFHDVAVSPEFDKINFVSQKDLVVLDWIQEVKKTTVTDAPG